MKRGRLALEGEQDAPSSPAVSPGVLSIAPPRSYYTRSCPPALRLGGGGPLTPPPASARRAPSRPRGRAGGGAHPAAVGGGEAAFFSVCSSLSCWSFVGAAEPLGIFGECTPHTYATYARSWRAHGLGSSALADFHHMGSGLGVAVFAALLVGGAGRATGVEWNGHAVDVSERVAAEHGIAGAHFFQGSYMDLAPHLMQGRAFVPIPRAARFLYAFDLNYAPRKVGGAFVGDSSNLHCYVSALNKHRSWRFLHTCIPLDVWQHWGLKGALAVEETLKGKMRGSGSGFTSFIISRNQ